MYPFAEYVSLIFIFFDIFCDVVVVPNGYHENYNFFWEEKKTWQIKQSICNTNCNVLAKIGNAYDVTHRTRQQK